MAAMMGCCVLPLFALTPKNKMMKELDVKKVSMANIPVGDQIKILSGAWEDTVGEIVSINECKQCVTINVEMFGRETPVEIDFTDVKLL
jgi:transcriptional antiterminator NusG